jgi:transposase-like protein
LEALRQLAGGKSFGRLARELELHENVLRRWQREYEKEPGRAFPGKGQGKVWLDREAELERKIGQMTLENDFLKKALQRWRNNGCWTTSVASGALSEDRRRSSLSQRTISARNVWNRPSEPGKLLPLCGQ